MNFATAAYLRRATSRAKSDVANKMVSMLLHSVSRELSSKFRFGVADPKYVDSVADTFGTACGYCWRALEEDRASVEHLVAMNRFQLGLHVPGNVVVSCKKCNGEKRRDDQIIQSQLAASGWEAFLCHDSTRCQSTCKTCEYWRAVFPNANRRVEMMANALDKIRAFRASYRDEIEITDRIRPILRNRVDMIYRDCQEFASSRIAAAVGQITSEILRADSVASTSQSS